MRIQPGDSVHWTTYHFDDGKRNYKISILDRDPKNIEVMFSAEGQMHVLNDGANALKVYATVIKATKHYVERHPEVKSITYSSADSRTAGAYDRIARRLTKEVGGFLHHDPMYDEWVIMLK